MHPSTQRTPVTARTGRTNPRRTRLTLCLLVAVALLLPAVVAVGDGEGEIDTTRTMLQKWVENSQLITKEKEQWESSRELLDQQIGLVKRDIEGLCEKIKETQSNITEADTQRQKLIDENEKLKAAADSLTGTIATLEKRTLKMLTRLPDAVREKVRVLSQSIPTNPDETTLSLSLRFQNVVGVLNALNKLDREITVTSEVRTLADGSVVEVTALYVGLGQGYYVSGNNQHAGVGTATDEGWKWTPADDAADRIAKAIAIFKNEQVATYVNLPVELN
ncbi:MAG: DUF3450 family protein [Phycisphaera sp.]|nr:DUF3450 family protein [Phycisphaera sp.]